MVYATADGSAGRRLRVGMVASDELLDAYVHAIFVPRIASQELLQRSRLHVCSQRYGFDAFAGQLPQLTQNVGLQLSAWFRAPETI